MSATFSFLSDIRIDSELPHAFAVAAFTFFICYGAEKIRRYIKAQESSPVGDTLGKKELIYLKWTSVILLTLLHPVLLYLLFPSLGETSNIIVVAAPVVATLLFGWWVGTIFMVINVFVTAVVFRLLANQNTAEGRPKMVLSIIVISVVLYGADRLRRYIIQRKAMAQELVQAKKMEAIGRLAGGVAHDINNTLNAIMGSVYAHRSEVAHCNHDLKDLDNIVAACDRGAQLTQNLLGFARKSNYKRQVFSVNQVLESVISILKRTASKNITIIPKLSPYTPSIEGDRSQVENAIMNLCLNALDAMGEKGYLSLTSVTSNKEVSIAVSDTGHGMDAQIRERIFEPFFTTKAEGKGTGLGLSMVYGVVHAMKGRIDLESKLGRGTIVTLTFPKTNAQPEPAPEAMVSKRDDDSKIFRRQTVLLIDDEPLVLRAGSRMLRTLGCEVKSAQSGKEGIKLLKEKISHISVVIVDLVMPEMDGIATLEKIRELAPHIPAILVSGYTRESEHIEAIRKDRETVRFLAKPYRPDQLAEVLKDMVSFPDEKAPTGAA